MATWLRGRMAPGLGGLGSGRLPARGGPSGLVAPGSLENYSYRGWFSNIEIRGFTSKGGLTGLVDSLYRVDQKKLYKKEKRGSEIAIAQVPQFQVTCTVYRFTFYTQYERSPSGLVVAG